MCGDHNAMPAPPDDPRQQVKGVKDKHTSGRKRPEIGADEVADSKALGEEEGEKGLGDLQAVERTTRVKPPGGRARPEQRPL